MRGDCQRGFAEAAAQDGVELASQSFSWLSRRGHLELPSTSPAREALERIYLALGGDLNQLASFPQRRLSGDFYHPPTRTLIEIDESQHFTTARLLTLDLYPENAALGFDLGHYKALISTWRTEADGYFRRKPAAGFTENGRQKQRAYYDALRDLAAPAMGHPPLVRVPAPERNGYEAWATVRGRFV